MLTALVICVILALVVYGLYWRSAAKDVAPLKAALTASDNKVGALEAASDEKLRKEHQDNEALAREIAASGDAQRALEFLRGAVRKD